MAIAEEASDTGTLPAPSFSPDDLADWSGGDWRGPKPDRVTGFAIDSRAVRPGDCFVALPGSRSDGHFFLSAARDAGAACAMVRAAFEPPFELDGFPLLRVDDPRRALASLAKQHRARLRGTFVCIAGSCGKTTVKELTADLLGALGPVARTKGNWNNDLGVPLSLLRMAPEHRYGVFEVGMNHPGELDPLASMVRPHISVVTCVGPEHIEFFDGEESIAHEEAAALRALDAEGIAVLPADDKWFHVLRSHVKGKLCTVSLTADADYRIEPGPPPRFVVTEWATGESVPLEAPLPGRHVLSNAGLAIAVARLLGVSWGAIAERLRAFRPPSMRWEAMDLGGIRVINDAYNANPLSMRAALDAFAATPVAGRRWLVLGAMRELGAREKTYHEELGRDLAKGPWFGAIFVGAEGAWIRSGAVRAGFQNALTAGDAEEAGKLLVKHLRPGDAVLIKASRGVGLERAIDELRR